MFEEAGIRVQQVNVPQHTAQVVSPVKLISNGAQQQVILPQSSSTSHLLQPSSPTLNRLNAQEELDCLEEDHLDTDFVEEEVVSGWRQADVGDSDFVQPNPLFYDEEEFAH